MISLRTAGLLNEPKLIVFSAHKNYLGIRLGKFKLSVHRRYRGGCSFEHCKGHYFNLDLCSKTTHAWWSVMIYLYYNESLRSR